MASSRSGTSNVFAETGSRPLRGAVGIALLVLFSFLAGVVVGHRISGSVARDSRLSTDGGGARTEGGKAERNEDRRNPSVFLVPAGRSPIPQSGETFDEPVPPRPFTPATRPVPVPRAEGSIPWHEAGRHVGRTVTIEGEVVHTRNTGSVCFLDFAHDWQDRFYVVIFAEARDSWDQPPERYFLNRTVRIAGRIVLYRDRPQIRITDPRQITLVAEN